MLQVFKPESISYYSKNRHEDVEKSLGLKYKDLNNLLSESDITFLCVSEDAGHNFLDKEKLSHMKDGSLLVSFMANGIINEEDLLVELEDGRIRAISDNPFKNEAFKKLSLNNWYCFNGSNAFNTKAGIKLTSDMVTKTILNILETGNDKYKVN